MLSLLALAVPILAALVQTLRRRALARRLDLTVAHLETIRRERDSLVQELRDYAATAAEADRRNRSALHLANARAAQAREVIATVDTSTPDGRKAVDAALRTFLDGQ
jgi:hypothetical protein